LVTPGTCVAFIQAELDLCPSEDSGEKLSKRDRGLMTSPYTKPPWHMELYINENDRKFPPRIIGIRDNYPVATCCGLDEETDEANGRLIAAAPELLAACDAAVIALLEDQLGHGRSEANLNAVHLCRTARVKAVK